MGESLSKTNSQKLDKNTTAMLKDSHLRISLYVSHRQSISVNPSEGDDKESGSHVGFTKSQLQHCLRESSPPKVDSAVSQRLYTLMVGQRHKVYFTAFSAAYYLATAEPESLPHILFLVCDLNGDSAVTSEDIQLWLQAGGIEDSNDMRKAFMDAAAEQYKTRGDVKEMPAEGMDETAFTAALARSDIACNAELKKAFQGVVDRLSKSNPMPKVIPIGRMASETAGESSEGPLSPVSVDEESEGKLGKKKKSHHSSSSFNLGKHKRSQTVSVVTPSKEKAEKDSTNSELKQSTSIRTTESAITEDFSDDEEELARRKPIAFVIKSAEEAASESNKVNLSALALKPPQMSSSSLRVTSRGRRASLMGSRILSGSRSPSPGSPESARRKPNETSGENDVAKSPGSPFDSASMFGNSPFGENKTSEDNKASASQAPIFDNPFGEPTKPAEAPVFDNPFGEPTEPADDKKSQTSLFDNAPFGEPAKPADDKNAQTSLFDNAPFGEPAKPADSQTSLFDNAPFGEPAKPAEDDKNSQTSLFDNAPASPSKPAEDSKAQTSLFDNAPSGEPTEPADDKKSQTSLFDNAPFGEPAKPAEENKDSTSQTSMFDAAPFGEPAKPAEDDKKSQTSMFDNAPFSDTTKPAETSQTSMFSDNPFETKTEEKPAESQTSMFSDNPFGETKPAETAPKSDEAEVKVETKQEPQPEKQSSADDFFSSLSPFNPKPSESSEQPKPADNPFGDNLFFGSTASQPVAKPEPAAASEPTPEPVAAAAAAPAAAPAPEPEPVAAAAAPAPAPEPPKDLTPALKSSLNKGLLALEGAKFDEACFAFKILCGQVRESAPDKVEAIVNYYVACLAMKSLVSSLNSGQTLDSLPKEKQQQLASMATMMTQLKLHPTHKRAMLAIAAVFSDYAYTQFARQNGGEVPTSFSINCNHTCWKCHEPCDTTLPRCVCCGEPIVLTADNLDVVTSENVSALRRCTECHCFFSEVNASETRCPLCDGVLQ